MLEVEPEVVITNVLSLCPMQITFLQHGLTTSILFTRPTTVSHGSTAMPLLKEIETDVERRSKRVSAPRPRVSR